jgi:hypothetical protein
MAATTLGAATPSPLQEIVRMTKAGEAPANILMYAKFHRPEMPPRIDDATLAWLRDSGVAPSVVRYLSAIDVRASGAPYPPEGVTYAGPGDAAQGYGYNGYGPDDSGRPYSNEPTDQGAELYTGTGGSAGPDWRDQYDFMGWPTWGYGYGYPAYGYGYGYGYGYYAPYWPPVIVIGDGHGHGHGDHHGHGHDHDGHHNGGGHHDAWRERGSGGSQPANGTYAANARMGVARTTRGLPASRGTVVGARGTGYSGYGSVRGRVSMTGAGNVGPRGGAGFRGSPGFRGGSPAMGGGGRAPVVGRSGSGAPGGGGRGRR